MMLGHRMGLQVGMWRDDVRRWSWPSSKMLLLMNLRVHRTVLLLRLLLLAKHLDPPANLRMRERVVGGRCDGGILPEMRPFGISHAERRARRTGALRSRMRRGRPRRTPCLHAPAQHATAPKMTDNQMSCTQQPLCRLDTAAEGSTPRLACNLQVGNTQPGPIRHGLPCVRFQFSGMAT